MVQCARRPEGGQRRDVFIHIQVMSWVEWKGSILELKTELMEEEKMWVRGRDPVTGLGWKKSCLLDTEAETEEEHVTEERWKIDTVNRECGGGGSTGGNSGWGNRQWQSATQLANKIKVSRGEGCEGRDFQQMGDSRTKKKKELLEVGVCSLLLVQPLSQAEGSWCWWDPCWICLVKGIGQDKHLQWGTLTKREIKTAMLLRPEAFTHRKPAGRQ